MTDNDIKFEEWFVENFSPEWYENNPSMKQKLRDAFEVGYDLGYENGTENAYPELGYSI